MSLAKNGDSFPQCVEHQPDGWSYLIETLAGAIWFATFCVFFVGGNPFTFGVGIYSA
jgi:hypothetical protein